MIHILSGPIRSGKTSRLLQWAGGQSNLSGIATPDQGGLKKLYDLKEKQYYPFQINESDYPEADCTRIGKFRFSNSAFLMARQILDRAAQQFPDWLIIDEIGPLEFDGQGFEPVAGRIIKQYLTGKKSGALLLVIRNTSLQRAMDRYGITEFSFFKY